MVTIAEIKAAIEQLPMREIEELASWIDSHRLRLEGSIPADAWLKQARGRARPGVTTAQVMALTRG